MAKMLTILDYAPSKSRWSWARMVLAIIGAALIVVAGASLGELVSPLIWPPRYEASQMLYFMPPPSRVQVAAHLTTISSPAFLAPVAARHGMSLSDFTSRLTVRDATVAIDIEFLGDDPLTVSRIPADIANAYSGTVLPTATGRVFATSTGSSGGEVPHPLAKLGSVYGMLLSAAALILTMRKQRVRQCIRLTGFAAANAG